MNHYALAKVLTDFRRRPTLGSVKCSAEELRKSGYGDVSAGQKIHNGLVWATVCYDVGGLHLETLLPLKQGPKNIIVGEPISPQEYIAELDKTGGVFANGLEENVMVNGNWVFVHSPGSLVRASDDNTGLETKRIRRNGTSYDLVRVPGFRGSARVRFVDDSVKPGPVSEGCRYVSFVELPLDARQEFIEMVLGYAFGISSNGFS